MCETSFYLTLHLPTEPLLWRKCNVRESFNYIHSFFLCLLTSLYDFLILPSLIAKSIISSKLNAGSAGLESFMLMELGIDNKKRQRRRKISQCLHCDCIKFDSSVSDLSHANSYLVQPNFSLSVLLLLLCWKTACRVLQRKKERDYCLMSSKRSPYNKNALAPF